jgi:hypothetical protein
VAWELKRHDAPPSEVELRHRIDDCVTLCLALEPRTGVIVLRKSSHKELFGSRPDIVHGQQISQTERRRLWSMSSRATFKTAGSKRVLHLPPRQLELLSRHIELRSVREHRKLLAQNIEEEAPLSFEVGFRGRLRQLGNQPSSLLFAPDRRWPGMQDLISFMSRMKDSVFDSWGDMSATASPRTLVDVRHRRRDVDWRAGEGA